MKDPWCSFQRLQLLLHSRPLRKQRFDNPEPAQYGTLRHARAGVRANQPNALALSSCLIQIPITHAFHAGANRDGHIGRGELADRTNN